MKVKLTTARSGYDPKTGKPCAYSYGDIIEVSDREGKVLCERHQAIPVTETPRKRSRKATAKDAETRKAD